MNKRVLIIGGGVAGLGAALELLRKGCAVTVLEARERLGGRIHTVHCNGVPIELGAEFLHGQSKALAKILQAAKLSTREICTRSRVLENGSLRRADLWKETERIIERIDPKSADCSFLEFVEGQKFPPRQHDLAIGYAQGFDAARPEVLSAHSVLRGQVAASKMADTSQGRIDTGYSALIEFLEKSIQAKGGELITNAEVRRISWRVGAVEISQRRGGVSEELTADAAVVTLPLGVMKANKVKFDPPLTAKRDAIRGLPFGNVVRLTFVFREYWVRPKDFGFVHAWKEAFPTWWSDARGPLITGWAGGPKADALVGRADLEAVALNCLARIFSESVANLRRNLHSVHTHDWAQDLRTFGAYSYVPVNGLDLPKLLAESVEGTLFFAGEATAMDGQMGTVSGAFDSGLRAARELLEG